MAGQWLGDVYQGLAFDVVLHAGSLVAVIAYFRHEIFTMLRDWFGTWLGKGATKDSKLGWWVIIGTIPAGVLGILFKDLAEGVLRGEVIMGLALIVFGLLLGLADWKGRGDRDEYSLGLRDVLIIGFAQALALIPGTSRSGITMTAALFFGAVTRRCSTFFIFYFRFRLLPAASLLLTFDLVREGTDIPWDTLLVGFVVAAVSTYACIHYFLAFIRRIGMQPFVIYRLILGGLLLWFFL